MILRDYWMAIRRGWKLVAGAVVLALVAAAVYTGVAGPSYVSSTQLFVASRTQTDDPEELYQRNRIAIDRLASYAAVAASPAMATKAEEIVEDDIDESSVSVTVVPGTVLLTITATDPDRTRARDIAAAYAQLVPDEILALEAVGPGQSAQVAVKVVDEAELPDSSSSPGLLRNMMLAGVLGICLGLAAAILRVAFRREVASSEEV